MARHRSRPRRQSRQDRPARGAGRLGRIELFEYLHPHAIAIEPTLPHEIGMHRAAFRVDDLDEALAVAARHGCHPLRGVANYQDVFALTYVRGPSGTLVMLAEDLTKR